MGSPGGSEDEAEEEEEEEAGWLCKAESPSRVGVEVPCPKSVGRSGTSASRVIVHIDMDCFYAQVEMIRNPELRNKPLGIQQKYIVVTCNYEARKFGVTKLMLIKDAREKCPQLVLVSGEDLTPYREMSYRATELLEEFSPQVERLGFDENYIDVTELVDKKLQEERGNGRNPGVCGHVYSDQRIGYKTSKRLESLGLSRISDLQACPITLLEKEFGSSVAHRIQMLSRGEDDSAVVPSGPPQSISDEDSFKKCSTVSEVKIKMEERLRNLLVRISKDGRIPHTLRLTIRQFSPSNKWFNRESRQCPIPAHISQNIGAECQAVPALMELLMRLFEKMIDVKMQFHLTLLNVCFSNLKASNSTRSSIGFYLTRKAPPAAATPLKGSTEAEQHTAESFPLKENSSAPHTAPQTVGQPTAPVPTNHHTMLETLPEGIDLEVFSQLPEEIQQEIIAGQRHAAASSSSSVRSASKSQAAPPKGILNFFSRAKAADLPSQCDGVLLKEHSQTNRGSTEATQGASSNFPKGVVDVRPTGSLWDPKQEMHPFGQSYDTDQSAERCGTTAEPMDSCCSSSTSCGQLPPQSAEMECAKAGGDQERAPFPHSVDVNVFSQLPEEVQRELMAEWKQLKPTPKIPVRKQSEKAKASRGKRTGASAGASSLLKYFKPS
ncbi:hypothetical protein XENTR_v10003086 [Xenopus tropicalis]|nr:hypothetical protein XENTR_v10003086 [Xenopus tropicalis]